MHSVTLSATENRRERKMQETSARLTSLCRRFTAERGLAGFTVEEVCEQADVSRRTFFNYFASKDDAVLGANPDEETEQLAVEFLARASRGWAAVLDDLVDLVIDHFEAVGVDAVAHAEFVAAVEREPRLLLRFMGISRDRDRQVVELVALREKTGTDDPHVEASVSILSTLIRTSGDAFLDPGNTREFAAILRGSLSAMRAVLASPTPRKAQL